LPSLRKETEILKEVEQLALQAKEAKKAKDYVPPHIDPTRF
jgi:hypothetical protein